MTPRALPNLAIAASAGSGKTFQLAHRYIRLLAGGVAPERICALTFSRKAAGEIFDSIVGYLWKASDDAGVAARTGCLIDMPSAGPDVFRGLLRVFLDSLHRLHIGTLDSFIISVVRAFPGELGVASEFTIVDGESPAAEDLRFEVLRGIFDPGAVGGRLQRAFFEAFKQATFGHEDKALGRQLGEFLSDGRAPYRVLPDGARWGEPACIWPCAGQFPSPVDDLEAVVARVRVALVDGATDDRLAARWRAFLDAVSFFGPGGVWSGPLEYLFVKLLPVAPDLLRGSATVRMDRVVCIISGTTAHDVMALLRHVLWSELRVACERTRGLHRVLSLFEKAYADELRRSGRFTFEDAQYLLTPASPLAGGLSISRMPDAPGRLYIDYRLDCRLDHWLLDEFQDTSDLQWAVLSNLVDELVQDDSGTRSLFYVGDVKQAIYGWRGGNARLFGAVRERYARRLEEQPLNASYRSCPPIIDTVNRVFGGLGDVAGLPPETVADWAAIWRTHSCSGTLADVSGCAMLLEPYRADGAKPEVEDEYATVADLLNELRPLSRGLDVAVLVRTNRAGGDLVDVLRRRCPDMPVVHEGRATIVDNPVVALMLAVMRFAAHPGDTVALRHIQMSPLAAGDWFRGRSCGDASRHILDTVAAHGFQECLRGLGRTLGELGVLDAFGRRRLDELLEAAAAYDQTGGIDVDAFVRFVQAHRITESAAAHAVRVMTVHQAKGLGFDVVIVPDLMGRSMSHGDSGELHLARDPRTQQPRWVLRMPRRVVAEAVTVLADEQAAGDAAAALDALSVLYVALTRAKRGLYLVTRYPGKTASSLDAAALLKTVLTEGSATDGRPNLRLAGADAVCLYASGDPAWFRALPERARETPPAAAAGRPAAFAGRPSMRRRLARQEPSLQDDRGIQAAKLFAPDVRDVLDFGTAIHSLFEKVAFIEDADPAAIVAAWGAAATATEPVRRDVAVQFQHAMRTDDVRKALSRPAAARVALWRERSFEIVIDDTWVSGQFDRVVIERDADDRVCAVTILDYKSNRIEDTARACADKAEHYRPQMQLYRKALGRILAVPETAIACGLVFTRIGRVAWVA